MKITLFPRAIGEKRHDFNSADEFKSWAYGNYTEGIPFASPYSALCRKSVEWWENHILPYSYFTLYKNYKED